MRDYVAVTRSLLPVLHKGRSLDTSWDPKASPLAKQIAYGVLRDYYRLDFIVSKLVKKPLPEKHLDIKILLMAGLYSIEGIRRPAYASVNDAVESALELGKGWAKGMVNGVLRNYQRNKATLDAEAAANDLAATNHPDWLRQSIESAWPDAARSIMAANNRQAPMTLRVNTARTSREAYMATLAEAGIASHAGEYAPTAIYLEEPTATTSLPGFEDGYASVQDEASQLVAPLMDLGPGMRVLDGCAAPGGKTCHMLELAADIDMVPLDIDEDRIRQVKQNLARLGFNATVIVADLGNWQAEPASFDRILLDAPCSATGIIRRHPDIKLLRRETDIDKLVSAQLALLHAAWRLLKPGGQLVYSTCSILPAENEMAIAHFLSETADARPNPIEATWGQQTGTGRQLFPVADGHDGFFYARLVKEGQAGKGSRGPTVTSKRG